MQLKQLSAIALILFSSGAIADVQLTKADILGTWQIDKESVNSDGSNARGMNTTWTFKEDGTMEGISEDTDVKARVNQLRAVLNYSLDNGKLVKQAAPGRSKMETCVAIEKDAAKMTLKCPSSYFFMSKK